MKRRSIEKEEEREAGKRSISNQIKNVAEPAVWGEPETAVEKASLWLFPVLLFCCFTISAGWMSLLMAFLTLLLAIGKKPLQNLHSHLSLPVIGLLLFFIISGISAIYARVGSYAIFEYAKLLVSVSMALLVLVRAKKRNVRSLLWGLAAVSAAVVVLCVDASGSGYLYQGFAAVMEKLGSSYASVQTGTAYGTRINGIFNDGNLSASLFALGNLISLHLSLTGKEKRKRFLSVFLLGVNAVGFLLAMSRGALLCFCIASILYLITIGRENRTVLFLFMVETAIIMAIFSSLIMYFVSSSIALSVLLTLLSGVALNGLNAMMEPWLPGRIAGHGRGVAIAICVVGAVLVAYAVAAMNLTGDCTLTEGEQLVRTVDLSGGHYSTSDVSAQGKISLVVYSRNEKEVLTDTQTTLYEGDLKSASFTVPEDAKIVFLGFTGGAGSVIHRVTFSDGTAVKLGYKLLPEFVIKRLQGGLLNSSSFSLRVQYDKDALKLFLQSPLLGSGIGSTAGLLPSVQPFYYQAFYVHNDLLQILDDTGILGLVSFLLMMLGAMILLIRSLRRGNDPLAAMFLACLAMMNLHGLMEFIFSIQMYQTIAFVLLMLICVEYVEPVKSPMVKYGGLASACCLWICLAVFGTLFGGHLWVQKQLETFSTTSVTNLLDTCQKLAQMDVFDHEQIQLTYVANAVQVNSSKYNRAMLKYVKELRKNQTYTGCSGLAANYYLEKGDLQEMFVCSRDGIAQQASRNDAWNQQIAFYRDTVLPNITEGQTAEFISGVNALSDYLTTYSSGRMEQISIDEDNQAFLNAVQTVQEQGISNQAAYAVLSMLVQTQPDENS